jgi:hypothetical protein
MIAGLPQSFSMIIFADEALSAARPPTSDYLPVSRHAFKRFLVITALSFNNPDRTCQVPSRQKQRESSMSSPFVDTLPAHMIGLAWAPRK